MTTELETRMYTGRVGQAFADRIHLQGDPHQRWLTISEHYDDPPNLLNLVGENVRVTVDMKSYHAKEIVKIAPAPSGPSERRRESLINRQWCLRSATELLSASATQEPDPDLALRIAAQFEEWVLRPTED